MALVEDWHKPLEESVRDILRSDKLTFHDLEEAEKALGLLPETEGVSRIRSQLNGLIRKFESDYQKAVDAIEKGASRREVENAVSQLSAMGNYREAAAKIGLGKQKIQSFLEEEKRQQELQRKRSLKKKLIAAAAVVIVIAGALIYMDINAKKRLAHIEDLKAQAQTMIDQGNEEGVAGPLRELINMNVEMTQLYPLTENALISKAEREGFKAAFELRDSLMQSIPYAVSRGFNGWADDHLNMTAVPAREKWTIVQDGLSTKRLKEDAPVITDTYRALLASVTQEAQNGTLQDAQEWAAGMQTYVKQYAADPDTALQLCYALQQAGQDPGALFPEGIRIDVPVGASVSALNGYYFADQTKATPPDMAKALPVHIIESKTYGNGSAIQMKSYRDSMKLDAGIGELQADDSHYSVMLLPAFLMQLPEDKRPASYAECTFLAAKVQTYLVQGYTYTSSTKDTKNSYLSNYFGSKYTTTSNYQPYFLAVSAAAYLDLRQPDHFTLVKARTHEPVIATEGWYDQNKNNWDLHDEQYTLGVHDAAELEEDYRDAIENVWLYEILTMVGDGSGSGDETPAGDGTPAVEEQAPANEEAPAGGEGTPAENTGAESRNEAGPANHAEALNRTDEHTEAADHETV